MNLCVTLLLSIIYHIPVYTIEYSIKISSSTYLHISRRLPCENINNTPAEILPDKMLQRYFVRLRIYLWFTLFMIYEIHAPHLASADIAA